MADGAFPSLVSKDTAINAAANPIWVELTDGTSAIGVTGGALDVNIDNSSIAVTGTFYRDLKAGTGSGEDNVLIFANTVKDGTGTDLVPLVDADGNLQVDVLTLPSLGTVNVDIQDTWSAITGAGTEAGALRVTIANDSTGLLSVDDNGSSLTVDFLGQKVDDAQFNVTTDTVVAIGAMADETAPDSVDEGDIGIPRMTLDRKLIIEIADATTDGNRLAVNSNGSINVNVTSAAITGEVHDYDSQTFAGGVGTTVNHDYTVSATMLIKSIIIAASGNMKTELKAGPLATLATYGVFFLNDRQGDTKQIFFDPPIEVPSTSTGTVRLVHTNRQGTAMDTYSTIIGIDA